MVPAVAICSSIISFFETVIRTLMPRLRASNSALINGVYVRFGVYMVIDDLAIVIRDRRNVLSGVEGVFVFGWKKTENGL